MLLLALAIAPGIAIAWYFYHKDRYNREPKRYLIVSFFLGMLSTLPAIVLETTAKFIFGDLTSTAPLGFYAFYAFVIVASSEELCKFMMVRLYAWPKRSFDEPFDGIVYSVMVAMGFATLENINYVQQFGVGTAFARMFLSVPAHASFAVLSGYYVGLAKFSGPAAGRLIKKGLLIAILFHGAFDFFIFLQGSAMVTRYVSGGLLVMGALVSWYIAIRLSVRSVRLHEAESEEAYRQENNL